MPTSTENILQELYQIEMDFLASSRDNRPVVACLCLRVPPEYIEAAGASPLRIAPRPGTDHARTNSIRPDGCSFCRTVPAILETGYYHNLKAVIGGTCCDQMRRLLDTLEQDLDVPVILFGAPRTWNADRGYFLAEMKLGLSKISEITGKTPAEADLWECIHTRNKLKRRINDLRQNEKLSTAILHQIACSPLPPADILSFLERFDSEPPFQADIRLLLAGSIPGVWELGVMEWGGAKIVADVTCLGDRPFRHSVPEEGDPTEQLYDTYVEKNDCPHRRPVTLLIDYIKDTAVHSNIDGIIYRSVKYCHPWSLLAERMRKELDKPILIVDDDLTSPAVGNLRTRVGAFIEMLKIRSRKSA